MSKKSNPQKLDDRIIDLIEKGLIICMGDNLVIEGKDRQSQVLFQFVRIHDSDKIHLASPTGVIIREAQDLFDYCQKFSKERYLEFADKTLSNLESLSKIKAS